MISSALAISLSVTVSGGVSVSTLPNVAESPAKLGTATGFQLVLVPQLPPPLTFHCAAEAPPAISSVISLPLTPHV